MHYLNRDLANPYKPGMHTTAKFSKLLLIYQNINYKEFLLVDILYG